MDIILASSSAARKSMLENAGINFRAIPADIDEETTISAMKAQKISPENITLKLAEQKALAISKIHPSQIIIGSDQILFFEGEILSKAKNVQDGKGKLQDLRGHTHTLISAVCVVQNGKALWSHANNAQLTMHNFNDAFLDSYILADSDALTSCVGGYKIEGRGAWLFSDIHGDAFTIMGMPLLPLLAYLKDKKGYMP